MEYRNIVAQWLSTPLFNLIKKEKQNNTFFKFGGSGGGGGSAFFCARIQGWASFFSWYPNEGGPPKNEVRES